MKLRAALGNLRRSELAGVVKILSSGQLKFLTFLKCSQESRMRIIETNAGDLGDLRQSSGDSARWFGAAIYQLQIVVACALMSQFIYDKMSNYPSARARFITTGGEE